MKLIYMLVAFLLVAALYGVGWIATCGIIYLITLCFRLTFDWLVATVIWMILVLILDFKVIVKRK